MFKKITCGDFHGFNYTLRGEDGRKQLCGVKAHQCSKRCSWIQLYAATGARWSGGRREATLWCHSSSLFWMLKMFGKWTTQDKKKKKGTFTSRREGGGRRVAVREAPLSCQSSWMFVGIFMDMWGGFELAENQSKAKGGKPLKQTVFSSKEVRLPWGLSCIPIAIINNVKV